MYKVPFHIKAHVNRIVREYELLLQQGHKVALQMFKNNRILYGLETTEYCIKSARHFRYLLDSQDDYLTSETEEEFRRKVYNKIQEFYNPLSKEAIYRIERSCYCQDQLKTALQSAKRKPSLKAEAKLISSFISNACVQNWSKEDEAIVHKEFKLVKTEEAFEKLINGHGKYPTIEITHNGEYDCNYIRIAFQSLDIPTIYKKRSQFKELRNFWNTHFDLDNIDLDFTIFNMWNNIAETGIYHVYIPKN